MTKNYTDLIKKRNHAGGKSLNYALSDECYTPSDQILPLLEYLDKDKTYYEPTSGKSSLIVEGFDKNEYKIVPSDGKDFFDCGPDDVYDGIITNPPYSIKDKFIEHCYSLGKPFALLLPVTSFQGGKRGRMFIEHGMSTLVYNNRVDFTGSGNPTFGNAWFMWGIIPSNTIYWVDNPKTGKPKNTTKPPKSFDNLFDL